MTTNFDIASLNKMMGDFFLLTGIKIVVYDADLEIVAAMPDYDSLLCAKLKNNPESLSKCNQCTKNACLHSKKSKNIYLYHCHAGLIEAVTPLFINNTVVGYIMLGQIRKENDDQSDRDSIIEYASQYADDIAHAFSQLTTKSEEHIQAAVKVMEICAYYLLMQNYIKIDKETLALKISTYIEDNLTSPLSVSSICSKFSLSHNMLYKIFEDFFGMPVAKYIRRARINRAKELIKEGYSVTETSIRVGFSDYSYFSKVFKSETGMLPTKFKNK